MRGDLLAPKGLFNLRRTEWTRTRQGECNEGRERVSVLGTRKVTCHWLGQSERLGSRLWQFRLAWRGGEGHEGEVQGSPTASESCPVLKITSGKTGLVEKEVKKKNSLFPSVCFHGRKC